MFLGQKWSYVMWHLLQCQLMHNRCEVITYRSVPHMHCTACTSTLSNKCSTKPRVELTVMIGTSLSEPLQYVFHQTKSRTNSDDLRSASNHRWHQKPDYKPCQCLSFNLDKLSLSFQNTCVHTCNMYVTSLAVWLPNCCPPWKPQSTKFNSFFITWYRHYRNHLMKYFLSWASW